MLLYELHRTADDFKAWQQAILDEEEQHGNAAAANTLNENNGYCSKCTLLQQLVTNLCCTLAYRGQYSEARRLLSADLQPLTMQPGVCRAWGREALVLCQLARGDLAEAVCDIIAAPSWASVYSLGHYVASVLEAEHEEDLVAADLTAHLAAAKRVAPEALAKWRQELAGAENTHGLISAVPIWKAEVPRSDEEDDSDDDDSEGNDGDEDNERVVASIGAVVRHAALGETYTALKLLLLPVIAGGSGLPAAVADALCGHHLLPSVGLHHPYSCCTAGGGSTAGPLQRLERELSRVWASVPRARTRIAQRPMAVAKQLAGRLARLALNRGDVAPLLVPTLLASSPQGMTLAGQRPKGRPHAEADGEEQSECQPEEEAGGTPGGDRGTDSSSGTQGEDEGAKAAAPAVPSPCKVVKHATLLMGLSQDLARGVCAPSGSGWGLQEAALLAAAPAPGLPPAYVLLPRSTELLRQALACRGLGLMQQQANIESAAGGAPAAPPPAHDHRACVADVRAAALALALAEQPSAAQFGAKLGEGALLLLEQELLLGEMPLEEVMVECYSLGCMHATAMLLLGHLQPAVQLLGAVRIWAQGQPAAPPVLHAVGYGVLKFMILVMELEGRAHGGPERTDGLSEEAREALEAAIMLRCHDVLALLPEPLLSWGDGSHALGLRCCVLERLLALRQQLVSFQQLRTLLERALLSAGSPPAPALAAGGQVSAALAAWCDKRAGRLRKMCHVWHNMPPARAAMAAQHLAALLHGVLAGTWPQAYAMLMGSLAGGSPLWFLPQQLVVACPTSGAGTDPWVTLSACPTTWLAFARHGLVPSLENDPWVASEQEGSSKAQAEAQVAKAVQALALVPRSAWREMQGALQAQQQAAAQCERGQLHGVAQLQVELDQDSAAQLEQQGAVWQQRYAEEQGEEEEEQAEGLVMMPKPLVAMRAVISSLVGMVLRGGGCGVGEGAAQEALLGLMRAMRLAAGREITAAAACALARVCMSAGGMPAGYGTQVADALLLDAQ